jgi:hypothetical protein
MIEYLLPLDESQSNLYVAECSFNSTELNAFSHRINQDLNTICRREAEDFALSFHYFSFDGLGAFSDTPNSESN